MKFLFLSAALSILPSFAFTQDSLRLLTWNVQMLPSVAKSNGKAKRARAIVSQLNTRNYDVLIFQELFHKHGRKIITEGLKKQYPYQSKVLNKKAIALKTNGGVLIMSKYPIRKTAQIRYKKRKGVDRLSRKGALLAEMEVHGIPVQVVGTHLQAFGTQEILYSQYHQLADELLAPHTRPGVPQLICGDFNTLKALPPQLPPEITQDFVDRLPRYVTMLQTLKAVDGELEGRQQFTMDRPYNDLCETRKEYRLLLDYVLMRHNDRPPSFIQRRVQIIRQRWHPQHEDLSDHFGVEAVMAWK